MNRAGRPTSAQCGGYDRLGLLAGPQGRVGLQVNRVGGGWLQVADVMLKRGLTDCFLQLAGVRLCWRST